MEIQVSVHDWLELPMQVRQDLRAAFQIPKSEGALVEGGIVKSDGTTRKDLQAITVDKMQIFLEAKDPSDDFVSLFNACVAKIVAKLTEEPVKQAVDPSVMVLAGWAAEISRMASTAQQMKLTDEFQALIIKFLPNDPITTSADTKASGPQSSEADQGGAKGSGRTKAGRGKTAKASDGGDLPDSPKES